MSGPVDVLAAIDAVVRYPSLGNLGRLGDVRAAVAELIEAMQKLIAWSESEIHNEYDGTSMLEDRLSELDFARASLANVRSAS